MKTFETWNEHAWCTISAWVHREPEIAPVCELVLLSNISVRSQTCAPLILKMRRYRLVCRSEKGRKVGEKKIKYGEMRKVCIVAAQKVHKSWGMDWLGFCISNLLKQKILVFPVAPQDVTVSICQLRAHTHTSTYIGKRSSCIFKQIYKDIW